MTFARLNTLVHRSLRQQRREFPVAWHMDWVAGQESHCITRSTSSRCICTHHSRSIVPTVSPGCARLHQASTTIFCRCYSVRECFHRTSTHTTTDTEVCCEHARPNLGDTCWLLASQVPASQISQLTLENVNTVYSLRETTVKDTQTSITLTQVAADLREVRSEISNLQHEVNPLDPLVSEQITVSNNTPAEVPLHTPGHIGQVLLDVTQTGPPAPTTVPPAVPHLDTMEPPSQHLVGTVVTKCRSSQENRGQHRYSVLHTSICLGH